MMKVKYSPIKILMVMGDGGVDGGGGGA